MSTRARAWGVAAVWGGCLIPTAALNIYPHVAAVLDGSPVGPVPHVIMIVVKAAFVIGAAYLLVKAETVATWRKSLVYYGVWAVLATVCFYNALDGGSKLRDQFTAPAREWQDRAEGLKSRIADLEKSRAEVPHHTAASAAMVESAQGAVTAAERQVRDECKPRGPFCREREADERAARDRLTEIEGRAMLTGKLFVIDGELEKKREELRTLGKPPKSADPAAAALAGMLGTDEATVTERWPLWLALAIEVWATLGAYCFLPRPERKLEPSPAPAGDTLDTVSSEPVKKVAAPRKAAVRKSAASPARAVKPLETKATGAGAVREWHASAVFSRDSAELRVKDVRANFEEWCAARAIEPVSLTVFGTMMKKELGVNYVERSKRGYYTGIGLRSVPVLAVVNK